MFLFIRRSSENRENERKKSNCRTSRSVRVIQSTKNHRTKNLKAIVKIKLRQIKSTESKKITENSLEIDENGQISLSLREMP